MIQKEKEQNSFWDDQLYKRRVKPDHELMKIREAIDWSFVEAKTKKCYCVNNGRKGYPPAILFRMLFLEFYDNLSDREVEEQSEYNLLYQKFVGIGMEDDIPESTTLVEFRKRLGEKLFQELFAELISQLKKKKLLSEKVAAVDATHMEADIAKKSIMNLMRQGKRKLISEIQRGKFSWGKELINKYPVADEKRGKSSDSELQTEMHNTADFLKEIKGKMPENEYVKKLTELLGRLSRGELVHMVNFEDMDARWGHKSEDKVFAGYKVHASMDDSGIVTSAQVIPGNENEGVDLEDVIKDDRSKGIKSECVVADGLYDNIGTYELQDEYKVPIYTPCRHTPKGLERHYFFLDKKGYFKCRSYKTGRLVMVMEDGRFLFEFNAAECCDCLSKGSCVAKGQASRQIIISKCYMRVLKQKAWLREAALEQRKRIEAKFGEVKKWHGMDRARYRGSGKTGIQALMTFIVVNAKRMVKLMAEAHAPPGSLKLETAPIG